MRRYRGARDELELQQGDHGLGMDMEADENEEDDDDNDETHCYCRKGDFGEMIACDNADCPVRAFAPLMYCCRCRCCSVWLIGGGVSGAGAPD